MPSSNLVLARVLQKAAESRGGNLNRPFNHANPWDIEVPEAAGLAEHIRNQGYTPSQEGLLTVLSSAPTEIEQNFEDYLSSIPRSSVPAGGATPSLSQFDVGSVSAYARNESMGPPPSMASKSRGKGKRKASKLSAIDKALAEKEEELEKLLRLKEISARVERLREESTALN